MREVVYVDVLVILNTFVNYFLLLATSFALKEKTKRLRILSGAFFGGIYALVVFLPEMGVILSVVSRLAAGVLIVLLSFGYKTWKRFLKIFLVFILMTFLFAGLMIGMWIVFKPRGMLINNSTVYFQISLPVLVISTSVCYIVSKVALKFINKNKPQKTICEVELTIFGKKLEGIAMLDTGNTLSEGFSGYPVVICTYNFIKNIVPDGGEKFFKGDVNSLGEITDENWRKKLRIVSFMTVGDTGLLPAFQPDKLTVDSTHETDKVYVGIMNRKKYINENFDMLLNPNLF